MGWGNKHDENTMDFPNRTLTTFADTEGADGGDRVRKTVVRPELA
jgi:hypothetical protein